MSQTHQRKRVGIVIFDDVEVLDYCGPFEVFSVTRLDENRRTEDPSPFEVHLIAESDRAITTTGGMKVLPSCTFETCPPLEILVIPGGVGTRRELNNPAILSFVRSRYSELSTLASVCTGSLVLGNTGLLNGLRATTHWRWLGYMQNLFPSVQVDRESHVVDQGKIITSAGISAGIDMALLVVARYFGEAIARETACAMEYAYPESNGRRVEIPVA